MLLARKRTHRIRGSQEGTSQTCTTLQAHACDTNRLQNHSCVRQMNTDRSHTLKLGVRNQGRKRSHRGANVRPHGKISFVFKNLKDLQVINDGGLACKKNFSRNWHAICNHVSNVHESFMEERRTRTGFGESEQIVLQAQSVPGRKLSFRDALFEKIEQSAGIPRPVDAHRPGI